MAMSYEKATADFDALIAKDAEAEVTRLAKELLENPRPEVKGAACHAIAKLRLKSELLLHGSQSQSFPPANEALKYFMEASERHGEASVLITLAQAYLIEGDQESAIRSAKQANGIAASFKDKSVVASAQQTLCEAYVARGDQPKAMVAAKERVAALETNSSQDATALRAMFDALSTLTDMQMLRGMKEAAKKSAEKMSSVSEKLGDKDNQDAAKKSLSLVLVQSGKADEAPNRARALAAFERAMAAAERKSEADFKRWWYEVESLGGVADKDIRESLNRIREHEETPGLDDFLRKVAAPFVRAKNPNVIHQFTKRHMYVIFRTGGIQYGPRYQCVSGYRAGEPGGTVMAHLKPSSQSDDWEFMLGYHTGILDGSLQSGACAQAPVY